MRNVSFLEMGFTGWRISLLFGIPQLTMVYHGTIDNNNNSVALVRELTIPTERPLLVGEVSANFCG
jgi:hypothetical protein